MAELIRTKDVTEAINRAIMRGLAQGARIVQNYAVANVTRVLKRESGRLASSIYARVRRTRRGGILRVGTRVIYGRFWEFGFTFRRGRTVQYMAPRPWLRPAAEQAIPQIAAIIDLEVDRELKAAFGNVTIDIKLS